MREVADEQDVTRLLPCSRRLEDRDVDAVGHGAAGGRDAAPPQRRPPRPRTPSGRGRRAWPPRSPSGRGARRRRGARALSWTPGLAKRTAEGRPVGDVVLDEDRGYAQRRGRGRRPSACTRAPGRRADSGARPSRSSRAAECAVRAGHDGRHHAAAQRSALERQDERVRAGDVRERPHRLASASVSTSDRTCTSWPRRERPQMRVHDARRTAVTDRIHAHGDEGQDLSGRRPAAGATPDCSDVPLADATARSGGSTGPQSSANRARTSAASARSPAGRASTRRRRTSGSSRSALSEAR